MSNVEFEGDYIPSQPSNQTTGQQVSSGQSYYTPQGQSGGMTGWLLKKGIISDESQAKTILLGIVAFNIIATIGIIIYFL